MNTLIKFGARSAATIAGIALFAGSVAPVFADSVSTCTFYRDLTVGVTGSDVVCLQTYLITSGFSIPAGPTGYFGYQTQGAVATWQAVHGIVPPAGYFGPISRAEYLTLTAGSGGGGGGGGGTGRSSLSNFNLIDRGQNVRENDENDEIATANFSVTGGNASVNRVDLEFRAGSTNESVHPWDYLKSIAIYDGSTRIGVVSADSQSDWTNNGGGNGRPVYLTSVDVRDTLTGGRTANLDVKVTTLNSIDNSSNGQDFDVDVPDQGIHATDSVNDQLRTGDSNDIINFNVAGGNGDVTAKGNGDTAVVYGNGSGSYGIFTLKFKVTANGDDVYIPESIAYDGSAQSAGVFYDPNLRSDTSGASISANLASSADTSSGSFVVHDGDTEYFTATVVINPTSAGYYEVGLSGLQFAFSPGGDLTKLNLDQNDNQYHADPLYIPN